MYRAIEVPTSRVLRKMERTGVLIDAEKLRQQSSEIATRLIELEGKAYELAGGEFNLGSPKQIGQIFFEKLELPVIKKTPSGAPSTDEEVLQKLAEDYPLPKILLEHRGLSKLKSTYTDKLPRMGALAGETPDTQVLASLDAYAAAVGLAFQVVDDILDVTTDSATLGKTAGKDAKDGKPTYVSIIGLDASRALAAQLRSDAHAALAPFGARAQRLAELADLVVNRVS